MERRKEKQQGHIWEKLHQIMSEYHKFSHLIIHIFSNILSKNLMPEIWRDREEIGQALGLSPIWVRPELDS